MAAYSIASETRLVHYFVVRAIKDSDSPPLRQPLHGSPQVIMISLFARGGLERINLTWASLEMALLSRGAASITSTSKLTGMRAVVGLRANRILIFPVARSRAASASSALFAAMALTARSHVTVVPLADMRIARLVFSRLGRTSKKRQSLRREIFAHIARNAILQHPVLLVLRKHPALQRKVLMELARNLQLRNKLLRVAGD
jgi:hypothetical protein